MINCNCCSALLLLLSALTWLTAAEAAQFIADLDSQWIDSKPSPNDTANLIFNTVYSLPMSWPNRRYRNGHTILPGIIPAGTLLYHGRGDPHIPVTPEWTAVDSELSMRYCGVLSTDDQKCWLLTLVVERPLRVLYFDGYSGLKLPNGTIDSQDVITWGKVMPEKYLDEPLRIEKLCRWGERFGLDGFVSSIDKINSEVMLCDFSNGLKVDSLLQIKVPYKFPLPPIPNDTRSLPLDTLGMGEILSSKRIDEYPGDTCIQLHLHRLISFYDLSIAPSLASQIFGQHRLQHRVLGISKADIVTVKARIEDELVEEKWANPVSGIDWSSMFRRILQYYSGRLELIQLDLNLEDDSSNDFLRKIFLQLRGMIQPYDIFSARPTNGSVDERSWAKPVYEACATVHTRFLSTLTSLTPSERLMGGALEGTNREICRIITRMWADGVNHNVENRQCGSDTIGRLHAQWKQDIDGLMIMCKPACGLDEMCFLPIAPYTVPGADPQDDWIVQASDPQPACIPKHSR
ncbi:hypothetical protein BT96DRAFT_918795 [Gymnopus androsaceus JB14]|uniref:Uncharacterized protein n=1 Tax=Gymnopus androsaceus JB14 TaxID=1447944 RepID=A0A6A4HTJ1_9AGAR|nr:hypothetical protein BT96DRAFT_918795 [Gymnopus androsaceus JB14]